MPFSSVWKVTGPWLEAMISCRSCSISSHESQYALLLGSLIGSIVGCIIFPDLFPRPAYKPHSVHAGRPTPMIISLGCELPHTSCSLPEVMGLAVRVTGSHLRKELPLLDLAPCGGYLAAGITACAGGLLHRLFTLTTSHRPAISFKPWGRRQGVAVYLCGPNRQVARSSSVRDTPSRVLPGTLPCGVRTFLNSAKPLRSSSQPGTFIIP